MSTPPPLPPARPDPLEQLRQLHEQLLPLQRALFENPDNATARAAALALLPAERAERAKVAEFLRPRRQKREAPPR